VEVGLGRVEASINLLNALERAKARIAERPEAGLPAPRPYPALAKAGRRIIEGSYWIFLQLDDPTCYLRGFLCDGRHSQPPLSRTRHSETASEIGGCVGCAKSPLQGATLMRDVRVDFAHEVSLRDIAPPARNPTASARRAPPSRSGGLRAGGPNGEMPASNARLSPLVPAKAGPRRQTPDSEHGAGRFPLSRE
jgi:hypothetical protein